ncbi:CIC11C00000002246 [Sungouiella intermedia]|uniref:CIC11C00000002246 n=1 Tax=Sungouiella intermedia TaxID=45354 RepID=A0A1L0E1J8_9ASCO|nr:CIC11C00000002246 [[Candida] intermedia]
MPATLLYIRLNHDCCIPVRIFVNRKRILLSSRVAINEKSIIELSSINLIRLSNYDVTNLIFDMKTNLKEFLFDIPLPELFPQKSLLRSLKVARDLGEHWKCRVVTTLGYIADLRYKLGHLQHDYRFLEEKNISLSGTDSNDVALLTKEIKFSFTPVLKEENEDEGEEGGDEKKALNYKLHRAKVLSCGSLNSLDMYVLHRPRG